MSPLWHHLLLPPQHRAFPSNISSLAPPPSPSPAPRLTLPSPISSPPLSISFPFFSHPRLPYFPSSPAPLHSSAPALFRHPLSPRLFSTFRHRPSPAPDTPHPSLSTVRPNKAERRPLSPGFLFTFRHRPYSAPDTLYFSRYHSAKQDRIKGRSALFDRTEALHSIWPIRLNKIAFVQLNGRGAGSVSRSREKMGAERGVGRRLMPRSEGVLGNGEETRTAPKKRGAGKGEGDEERRKGDGRV